MNIEAYYILTAVVLNYVKSKKLYEFFPSEIH